MCRPDAHDAPRVPDHGAILRSVGEAAYEWRIDRDELVWDDNAAALLGIRDAALIASGRAYANLLDPGNAQTRFDAVMSGKGTADGKSRDFGVPYQVEYCLRTAPRAEHVWIEDNGRWFAGADGRPARAHGVIRCINERHAREQQLSYLSQFDGLTGETNRWRLSEILEAALQESTRARESCGFLLAAIDDLARVNEAYGYDVADQVIGVVAKRLRGTMRGDDNIGRFSGNKFGIVLRNCTPEEMAVAAERFLAGVRDDVVTTSAGPVSVTVTIGGVSAPRHAGSVRDVLSRAQETLDRAKARRPGSFFAYQPNIERERLRQENVSATEKIVMALKERRILLAYEPVVGARDRQVAFHECLLRVRHADGTLVPASDIVPVAERLGLVRLLDMRVLDLVIAELAAAPGAEASVNVSPASTTDPDWWARLAALLRENSGVAARLIVEITETAAIHDIDDTLGFVTRVKDLGCRIAIDDFGAGYTSFRNLRKLGVDIVKIDGAFVQNLTRSDDDRAFVQTLIELAQRLKIKTVAEWVQDEQTAAMLGAWGCDYLQGARVGHAQTERPWAKAAALHIAANRA